AIESGHPRARRVGRSRPGSQLDLAGRARRDHRTRPGAAEGLPPRHAARRRLRVSPEEFRRGREVRREAPSRGRSRPRAPRRAARVPSRFAYAEEVVKGTVPVGQFEPARLEKTRDTYTEYLGLKRKVPLEEIYTNDLLPAKK